MYLIGFQETTGFYNVPLLFLSHFQETTGGEDNVYNHDPSEQSQSMDGDKPMSQPNQQPPINPSSLPPELIGMLSSLQQGQQPDLMANVQNVLATVMVSHCQ
jgi:hypothetical protein